MIIKDFISRSSEGPLDSPCDGAGACAIFRSIACIGDSLASGEFEIEHQDGKVTFHDIYPCSWGQCIARMTGATVHNFSRGGMTAREYFDSFAEQNGFWDPCKRSDCYIMALGVNDGIGVCIPEGDVRSDVDAGNYKNNNLDTFAGKYAAIIQRYREIAPNSPFFLLTIPRDFDEDIDHPNNVFRLRQSRILYDLAELFPKVCVIDLFRYGPMHDTEFRKSFYLRGHMSPAGYLLGAKVITSYIDYVIRHDPDSFKHIGFINTPYEGYI